MAEARSVHEGLCRQRWRAPVLLFANAEERLDPAPESPPDALLRVHLVVIGAAANFFSVAPGGNLLRRPATAPNNFPVADNVMGPAWLLPVSNGWPQARTAGGPTHRPLRRPKRRPNFFSAPAGAHMSGGAVLLRDVKNAWLKLFRHELHMLHDDRLKFHSNFRLSGRRPCNRPRQIKDDESGSH